MAKKSESNILPGGVLHIPQTYPYQSIDIPGGEFRLMTLLPATQVGDPIHCELRTGHHESETYHALSYTWGNTEDRRTISLNGHDFFVTPNIESALRNLRPSNGSGRCLWIDAVCINHKDLPERGQSVMQMHKIYSHAERIVVWLGEQSEDSDTALDLLELATKSHEEKKSSIFGYQSSKTRLKIQEPTSVEHIDHWKALANFFGRPWWKRLWVVQEVAFARLSVLQCGKREMDFPKLAYILNQLAIPTDQPDDFESYVRPRLARARVIYTIYRMAMMARGEAPPNHLADILIELRSAEATDPKDKFFGCIHLGAPDERFPAADYEVPTASLFTVLAKTLIREEKGTRLLAACEDQLRAEAGETDDTFAMLTAADGLPRTFLPDLPSWAPNWAIPRMTSALFDDFNDDPVSRPGKEANKYAASGPHPAEFIFLDAEPPFVPERLAVKGLVCDTVIATTSGVYPGNYVDFTSEVSTLFKTHATGTPSPYSDPPRALRLTLCLGDDSPDRNLRRQLADDEMDSISFVERLRVAFRGRTFFITSQGYFGLGPRSIQLDDLVGIICGCPVPIMLREVATLAKVDGHTCEAHEELTACLELGCAQDVTVTPGEAAYRVIGEAYVQGFMNGEVFAGRDEEEVEKHLMALILV